MHFHFRVHQALVWQSIRKITTLFRITYGKFPEGGQHPVKSFCLMRSFQYYRKKNFFSYGGTFPGVFQETGIMSGHFENLLAGLYFRKSASYVKVSQNIPGNFTVNAIYAKSTRQAV